MSIDSQQILVSFVLLAEFLDDLFIAFLSIFGVHFGHNGSVYRGVVCTLPLTSSSCVSPKYVLQIYPKDVAEGINGGSHISVIDCLSTNSEVKPYRNSSASRDIIN